MTSSETLYAQLRDAVFDNDRARLHELLQHDGVDVDHFDAGGQTLLHLACFWGRMELVKVLLQAGASLKTKNAAACTALDLATHWGHSSVAEVIRLRGGHSVWEEKLGLLQVQVEDLRLEAQQAQRQCVSKQRDVDALRLVVDSLQTQLEEAKSANALSDYALAQSQREVQTLAAESTRLQQALDAMTAAYHTTMLEKASAQHLHAEAQRETAAALAHRDDVLHAMEASVAKQDAAAHNWQRAEVAAAIAESQRNFAFAERDLSHKKHVAALAELVVVTARLDAAEDELLALKSAFAEQIYELQREQKLKKRTARALSQAYSSSGETEAGTASGMLPIKPSGRRPLTTPVDKPVTQQQLLSTLSPPMRHRTESHATTAAATATTGASNTPTTTKASKKHVSLAAREFGDRLRADERHKQQERVKRFARTEQQYERTTQRQHSSVRAADAFQDEFVAAVQTFATTRDAKWHTLKKDRDRQAWFTRSVLARPIATAPRHTFDSIDELADDRHSSTSGSAIEGSKKDARVRFGVYSKYARPAYVDNPLRPVTSPLEVRMQQSFVATPARLSDGDVAGARSSSSERRNCAPPEDVAAAGASVSYLPSVELTRVSKDIDARV